MQVMLVEDSPGRTRAFRRELVGHHLHTFDRSSDALAWLSENTPDLAFLDYDLDQYGGVREEVGCGMDVIAYLVAHARRFARTRFIVHSLNPVQAPVMASRLRAAGLWATRAPCVWNTPGALQALVAGRA